MPVEYTSIVANFGRLRQFCHLPHTVSMSAEHLTLLRSDGRDTSHFYSTTLFELQRPLEKLSQKPINPIARYFL